MLRSTLHPTTPGSALVPTLALVLLASGCGDDGSADTSMTSTATETGDGDGDPTTTGDGDGDPTTTGDGDGDPTTGDGDGDDESPCAWQWEEVQMKANGQTHAAYDVAVAPNGNFVAVGKLENADDDAWIGMFDPTGTSLWEQVVDSGNGPDAAVGVVFDADGDVVLIGRQTGPANQDLWIEKRSGETGAVLWSILEASQFEGDNEPGGVGLAPDGDLVVTGAMRVGDQDLDVWTRKLSSDSGATVWTSSYSGSPDQNGFSVDRGLSLDVAADGSVYVGGSEGVNFETREAVLLRYDASGTEQWAINPRADGTAHIHTLAAVAAGPEGEAYVATTRSGNASTFWLNRVSVSGELDWEMIADDFVFAPTVSNFVVAGLDLADDGTLTVGGRLTNEETGQGISGSEAWIANVGLDGVGQCIASRTWENTNIIPARTFGYGFAEGPNGAVVVGEVLNGPQNYLWLGGFK
jgi:hypothetical protein